MNTNQAILYLIKCWNENEEFYKIGITTLSVEKRFQCKSQMPYSFIIISKFEDFTNIIYNLEKEIHLEFTKYHYFPKIEFGGWTECFNLDLPIEEIIKTLNQAKPS